MTFSYAEMFPADDVLSEWVGTLALALNDLALVYARLEEDQANSAKWLYWLRLGIAHFAEAGSYLHATIDVPEVEAFVASLDGTLQQHYATCLDPYEKHLQVIERIRNEAGFHYPEMKVVAGKRKKRPMQKILAALSDQDGQIETGKIREGRSLFADDIAASLLLRAAGGALQGDLADHQRVLGPVLIEIQEAIGEFVRFTNGAIDEYFVRRQEAGASVRTEPSPGETGGGDIPLAGGTWAPWLERPL